MTQTEALKSTFRDPIPQSRREIRAARTRATALSPTRILLSLLSVPLTAGSLTVSIYVGTSHYAPPDALRHLIALAGCDAAAKVGLAPAYRGGPGYHARNDADADGVACGQALPAAGAEIAASAPQQTGQAREAGGAKFLRP